MMLSQTAAPWLAKAAVQFFLILLLSGGIAKCWSISRRPTTNAKCVRSLMLFLIGWDLLFISVAMVGDYSEGASFLIGVGLIVLGLTIAAFILAIVGLVECGTRRGQYVQGKAQAIWALVLCTLFGMGAIVNVFRPAVERAARSARSATPPLLTFEELNFKFKTPARPWGQVDLTKLIPDAKLTFVRSRPDIYFAITAEPVTGTDLSADAHADLILGRMKATSESFRVIHRQPMRMGNLNGLQVEFEARTQNYHVHYCQWFCATNGWFYQLTGWGRIANRDQIVSETLKLIANFELLDYQRRPPLPGRGIGTDFVAADFGYRIRCGTPEWLRWNNLDNDCAYASFGVLDRRDAVLAVSACWLMDLEPRPDALYLGFLELTGIENTSRALSSAQAIREQGLEGIVTTFDVPFPNGKNYTYRMKILQGGGFAYAVSAWIDSQQEGKEEWVSNAVSLVEFSPSPKLKPDVSTWDERTMRVHRLVMNSVGMKMYREGGYAEAARYFEKAAGLGVIPGTAPYVGNLVQAYVGAGKQTEALDALERFPETLAAQPGLKAQQAWLQGRLGQLNTAISNYAALFASGYSAEDHFREYVGLLAENGEKDRALLEIENFLKKQDLPSVRLLQSGLLKLRKKFDEAITILTIQHQKYPFNASVAYALGDAYIQAGQPTEALNVSEKMVKQQGVSTTSLFLKGRAEFALKWYREAKESFERAQKESPSDSEVKQFLDAVSSILGEGLNSIVKDPIAPVSLPDDLATLPGAPPSDFGRDEGAYYQQAISAVSFERGKELKVTDYLTIKALNASGVSEFSTFQIPYNPLAEELYVNRLEVRDAAGSLVNTGRVADSYVLDDRASTMANSRKVLNLPVSGLQPGCIVKLVYTRRELGIAKDFTFRRHMFSRAMPVQDSVLYFAGETGGIRFASSPMVEPRTLGRGFYWRQANLPGVRWEPLLPEIIDYVPIVWLGDSTTAWPELVTNYLHSIRDRLDLPDTEQVRARGLTANIADVTQKVAAIAAYVQTNYTYKAIEFGHRAQVPQPLVDIVRNKYGDCKDHSILVQQMLRAAGIPSSLALVSSSAQNRRDLPSLDQFDHMIVHVPMPSGETFVDCTLKDSRLTARWSAGLAGREVLVLDATQPRFVRVGDYPTNASAIRTIRSVELTNRTDAFVREEIVLDGVHAGYMRAYLRNVLPTARHSYFSRFIGDAGQLSDLAMTGLEQPGSPLGIKMTYLLRGQFHSFENQVAGSPPAGIERAFLIQEPAVKRSSPFQVVIPLTLEGTVIVHVPSEFKPRKSSGSHTNVGNPFVSCEISTTVVDGGWRLNYRVYEPAARRPAEEYNPHCRALREVVELLSPRLVAEQSRR